MSESIDQKQPDSFTEKLCNALWWWKDNETVSSRIDGIRISANWNDIEKLCIENGLVMRVIVGG